MADWLWGKWSLPVVRDTDQAWRRAARRELIRGHATICVGGVGVGGAQIGLMSMALVAREATGMVTGKSILAGTDQCRGG